MSFLARRSPEETNGNGGKLVAWSNPRSPVAEAFRQLRTNIQFSSLDKPVHTLLVTSTDPEEGKSTTLANLAVTMAQTGSSVILVDCDLRRPTIHTLFGMGNESGLTNMVLGPGGSEAPLQQSAVPNLRLLASGPLPPNPSELLGSKRMAEIVAQLRTQADYILFDAPPIIAVTDAAVLATHLDGVLLIIKAGKTKRDLAKKAVSQLQKVNAPLLGVVLNNVKYDSRIHRYYTQRSSSGG